GRVDSRLEQLDDVCTILRTWRLELQIDEYLDGRDLERRRGWWKRCRQKRFACLCGQVIDDDAVRLDRDARLHRHESPSVMLERFVADQEIDVLRRAWVAVRSDGETTDEPVAHAQPGELCRRCPHCVEDA